MEELKRCPFCNGNAAIAQREVYSRGRFVDLWYVKCKVCKAGTNLFSDEDAAVYAWNMRANNE